MCDQDDQSDAPIDNLAGIESSVRGVTISTRPLIQFGPPETIKNLKEAASMDFDKLRETAQALVASEKGLLAMDESTPTANKRFAAAGIPQTEEARRAYRGMIVTTTGLNECLNGAILFDETIRQQTRSGVPFAKALQQQGIIPGIKVDAGAKPMAAHPGEKLTSGLDGLRERLADYAKLGARFAKWRAVISIGEGTPTTSCMQANALLLALYAALCQEAGLVPIVEPEVLMDGNHSLDRCAEVTETILHFVFDRLIVQRVLLEGMILKPNMVVPGQKTPHQNSDDQIADATVHTLLRTVPAAVPGVAFLSGGQSGEQACSRLSAMNSRFRGRLPWPLTYSFARAIQQPAMGIWYGEDAKIQTAQKALLHRAQCARAARRGEYTPAMENPT
jgi:fructose-bisphosphate aldolase, class I